jgi:hypothetical protein
MAAKLIHARRPDERRRAAPCPCDRPDFSDFSRLNSKILRFSAATACQLFNAELHSSTLNNTSGVQPARANPRISPMRSLFALVSLVVLSAPAFGYAVFLGPQAPVAASTVA